jgi:hypothetical protein
MLLVCRYTDKMIEVVSSMSMMGFSMIFFCCCLLLIIRRRKQGNQGGTPVGYVTNDWGSKVGTATMSGPWTSRQYGSIRENPIGRTCPKGQYITDVIGFHGQGEYTNALQAWCYDPKSKRTTRIFSKPTCGKRDKPDAKRGFLIALTPIIAVAAAALTVFFPPAGAAAWTGVAASVAGTAASVGMEIASGIDADKDVLKAGSGRALWDVVWTGSPYGYNRWSVREKDGVIQGLKFDGADGQTSTGWIGGNVTNVMGPSGPRLARNPTGNIVTQSCPKGYVLTGINATCGDRVDGLVMTCNRPA